MKTVVICGPAKSGKTSLANVFIDSGYISFDLNDYRTTDNPISGFLTDYRKFKSKIDRSEIPEKSIVLDSINNIDELEIFKTLNIDYVSIYLKNPNTEYVSIDDSGSANFTYAAPGFEFLCDLIFENNSTLDSLIEKAQNLVSFLNVE